MIAPETIALVRERTNIVAVIQESVPSLKRRGRSWVGLCPFHKEKTPSFHVNPERGFFHCFGCHEGGSAIDFLMKHDGLTFPEAVRLLADRCGIEVQEDRGHQTTDADRNKKHKDDLLAVMNVAATFYEAQLREHAQRHYAWEELAKRGLGDASGPLPNGLKEGLRPSSNASRSHLPAVLADGSTPTGGSAPPVPPVDEGRVKDTLQAFRIGFAPPAWDALALHLKMQGISPALAEEVGLLVARPAGGGHYDRFRHRLMFSVMDVQGRVVAFSGRALRAVEEGGGQGGERAEHARRDAVPPENHPPPVPKYINSPESPIYTKGNLLFGLFQARHAVRQADACVLVEGNFDVVSLHARGMQNVAAPLGTAFTDEQARLLRRYTTHAVLCFDGDPAGRKATRAAREPCRVAGVSARVASMPSGADPDSLAREKGIDAVKEAVARASELLRFLINDALDQSFSAADAFERSARVRAVAKLLGEEEDPLVRSLLKTHADEVAGRLDLVRREDGARGNHSPEAFRMLSSLMEQELRKAQATHPRPAQMREKIHEPGRMARREIAGALIEYPELLADPEVELISSLLENESARIVAALAEWTKTSPDGQKTLYTSEFLAQMPPAIHAFAAQRLASPQLESKDEARQVVLSNADKLRSMMLQRETKELSRELHEASDWEKELAIASEIPKRKITVQ